MKNSINNPFVSCTARDMSYTDVMRFWCSPFECYKLKEADLITSATPIVIEGARGSGKTMILKHLSYFCQKEAIKSDKILPEIAAKKFLGIYFRYSADYSSLFDSLNCSREYRDYLFDDYFQLCICLEIARIIQSFEEELLEDEKKSLFAQISKLCEGQMTDSNTFIDWIEKAIRKQDETIRRSQYLSLEISNEYKPKAILFNLINEIQTCVKCLSETLFIIIIDEYENIGHFQRVINTYIKQMDGENRYTFRIGVRPEGIRDYSTKVSDEFLQDGRDFIKKRLIVHSNDKTSKYKNFVKAVINRRLDMVPVFKQTNITIDTLLGSKENYEWEARYHVRGRKDHFQEAVAGKTEDEKNKIISVIEDDNPIIEAYFLMRLRRGETIEDIINVKQENMLGVKTENTKKYWLDMQNKYKSALLFWLIDKYTATKLYYGFATYLYLSCGSIYDFIGLCRTVFDELESDYFDNFEENPMISPFVQTQAAQKYAKSQLEKVRINHDYGPQMHQFVQNMCSLFKHYHKGDLSTTYPETNQFYISGNFDSNGVNKEIWRSLLRWGVVIKKTSYQRASLSVGSKAQLYYINKSYYPMFGISCRIRGGFNVALSNEIWDEMIVSIVDPASLIKQKNKKTTTELASKKKPKKEQTIDKLQLTLFDLGDFDE